MAPPKQQRNNRALLVAAARGVLKNKGVDPAKTGSIAAMAALKKSSLKIRTQLENAAVAAQFKRDWTAWKKKGRLDA